MPSKAGTLRALSGSLFMSMFAYGLLPAVFQAMLASAPQSRGPGPGDPK